MWKETGRLGGSECIERQDTRTDLVGTRVVVQRVDVLAPRSMSKEHLQEPLRAPTPRSAFLQVDPSSPGVRASGIPASD